MNDDREREELKTALIATQESASIQILLEAIEEKALEGHALCDRKEVQSIVCSYLHEVFIADPNMAKLVHFQVTETNRPKSTLFVYILVSYYSRATLTAFWR